jgi:hypothetical protein
VIQAKFSLEESHVQFLEQCKAYGFKDKSAVVRIALDCLHAQLEKESLKESAELYAQLYAESEELQQLTEVAIADWPE